MESGTTEEVHFHTAASPTAVEGARRLPLPLRRRVRWLYVTLPAEDCLERIAMWQRFLQTWNIKRFYHSEITWTVSGRPKLSVLGVTKVAN